MAILLNCGGGPQKPWREAFERALPGETIWDYPDIPDPNQVDYAIVWAHPPGELATFSNMKAVLSLGAGTEHFDADPNLPNVPIIRLDDPVMAQDMAHYALYWTIHAQRRFEDFRTYQARAEWRRHRTPPASAFRVLVLGLGIIGQQIAATLKGNGFDVAGWSRSPKHLDGIPTYVGDDLSDQLRQADVIVCALPINVSTRGFLGPERFAFCKPGAHLINVSRGAVVDEHALIETLNAGHMASAVLDVFESEPLHQAHPYWSNPKIHITPHISGMTKLETAVPIIAENIRRHQRGLQIGPVYDRARHNVAFSD